MDNSSPKLHFAKQSLVLHKDSKSHEKFMLDIYVAVARQYSNNLSEETRKGLNEKSEQGWYAGSHKRGYKTLGDMGHKIWVIDQESPASIFIPKAFELFNTGNYTLRTLAKELFTDGWKSKDGKQLYISELHNLLTDPFYCGEFIWNNKLYKSGKHPPMVSKELFYSVQDRLNRKIKAGKFRHHDFLFGGGLITCGDCGKSVTAESQKGHSYYHCTKFGGNCSQKRYTREEAIQAQIIEILDQVRIDNPRLLEWVRKALKEAHKDETEYHESTLKDLDIRLLKIEKRLSIIYDDRVDGVITKEQYEKKKEQYETEVDEIVEAKNQHVKADIDYRKLGINIFELSQKGREIYETKATRGERQEFLNFVFSNLKLKDGKVIPTFQTGFDIVALRLKEQNVQALVSELRKIWHTINLFDIQKIQDFLNPQPAYSF